MSNKLINELINIFKKNVFVFCSGAATILHRNAHNTCLYSCFTKEKKKKKGLWVSLGWLRIKCSNYLRTSNYLKTEVLQVHDILLLKAAE